MSLVEKALRSLKELLEPQQNVTAQIATSSTASVTKPRSDVEEIARFIGGSVTDIDRRCMESADATEWCSWIAELLRGRRRDPPSRPLPSSILEILQALLERGVNDPLVEQLVKSRIIIQRLVGEASDKAKSIVEDVLKGRHKVAVESVSSLIENVTREVKRLRGNPDEAVEQVLGSMEKVLREKYKVPVSDGEISSVVMDELKRVGLPAASEKLVSVIEAKVKKPAVVSPEEVKKLGSPGNEQQLELSKTPFTRM